MSLHAITISITVIVTIVATNSISADSRQTDNIKQLSGISIVGDKEAPKSLYIVPWHNTELEQNTKLSSTLMDNNLQPVDRDSFLWELELYELGKSGSYNLTP